MPVRQKFDINYQALAQDACYDYFTWSDHVSELLNAYEMPKTYTEAKKFFSLRVLMHGVEIEDQEAWRYVYLSDDERRELWDFAHPSVRIPKKVLKEVKGIMRKNLKTSFTQTRDNILDEKYGR